MGRAAALLRSRLALAAALLAVLGLYYWASERLPNLSELGDVLWVDFGLAALMFAPVYFALGLRKRQWSAVAITIASALAATLLHLNDAKLAASIPKLVAAAFVGFLFLRFCEKLWLLVAIALIIPVSDTLSVWRGPTRQILTTAPQVFDAFSVVSPIPGERVVTLRWDAPRKTGLSGYLVYRRRQGGAERSLIDKPFCASEDSCGRAIAFANYGQPADARAVYRIVTVGGGQTGTATLAVPELGRGRPQLQTRTGLLAPKNPRAETAPAAAALGLSDVIFFAFFLAGAVRFHLRPRLTWLALIASIGVTGVLADYWNFFHLNGFPALPGISLAFLLANADLIWRRLRDREEIDDDLEPRAP